MLNVLEIAVPEESVWYAPGYKRFSVDPNALYPAMLAYLPSAVKDERPAEPLGLYWDAATRFVPYDYQLAAKYPETP